MLDGSGVLGIFTGSVIVSVPAGVQDAGEGFEGGVGDLGEDGDLLAGLVPQDLQVERLEQLGLQLRRQAGQDVAGRGELVEQGGVGGFGGLLAEGGELGFELFAFAMELGEAGADPAAHRGGGGVGRVGGEFLEFQDAGVLTGLDPGDTSVRLVAHVGGDVADHRVHVAVFGVEGGGTGTPCRE